MAVLAVVLVSFIAPSLEPSDSDFDAFVDAAFTQPLPFIVNMLALIALVPVSWVSARRWGTLQSTEGHFRWSYARSTLVPALVVAITANLIITGLAYASGDVKIEFTIQTWIMLGLAALLLPFQSYAEELMFRGWLPQLLGQWVKNAFVVYSLPILLFTWGHYYNLAGLIDIAVFASCMSFLTRNTGGIEAAAVIHAIRNLFFFTIGSIGIIDLSNTEISWQIALLNSAMTISTTAWVYFAVRRGSGRTDAPAPSPSAQMPR